MLQTGKTKGRTSTDMLLLEKEPIVTTYLSRVPVMNKQVLGKAKPSPWGVGSSVVVSGLILVPPVTL